MFKIATVFVFAIGIAACYAFNAVTEVFQHARAVESDIEQSTGMRPQVGFNWNNGRLTSVTVAFPRIYEAKPLRELAETTRALVTREFKQAPENIVLAFSLGK